MTTPTEIWISEPTDYDEYGYEHVALSIESMVEHYQPWADPAKGEYLVVQLDTDRTGGLISIVYPPKHGRIYGSTTYRNLTRHALKDLS